MSIRQCMIQRRALTHVPRAATGTSGFRRRLRAHAPFHHFGKPLHAFQHPAAPQAGEPVTHPFVLNQVNRISVRADTPQNVILPTGIRGDIYASSGVLPRKSITVPKDFLDAALTNMEPALAVGPVFTVTSPSGVSMPLLPPPQVQGYDASFTPGTGDPSLEMPMPASAPLGDLPPGRAQLNEGWVRLKKRTA